MNDFYCIEFMVISLSYALILPFMPHEIYYDPILQENTMKVM